MFPSSKSKATLAALLISLAAWQADARVWTNDRGITFEADFVRVTGQTVVIRQQGETVLLELSELSIKDQNWVKARVELGQPRAWTMRSGSIMRGRYRELRGDMVEISTREGKKFLPLAKLSDADRKLLASLNNLPMSRLPEVEEPTKEELGYQRVTGKRREWTSTDGRKISAEYRGLDGLKAVLFFNDKEYRVPLSKLSTADQRYIENLEEKARAVMFDDLDPELASKPEPASKPASRGKLAKKKPVRVNSRWTWEELDNEFAGSKVTVRTTHGGIKRAWIDGKEVHGEIVQRVEAYIELAESRRQAGHEELLAEVKASPLKKDKAATNITLPSELSDLEVPDRVKKYRQLAQENQLAVRNHREKDNEVTSDRRKQGIVDITPYETEFHYTCFTCNKEFTLSKELKLGDQCPHCKTRFDYLEDESGEVIDETPASSSRRYRGLIKLAIFGVLGFGSFLGWLVRRS